MYRVMTGDYARPRTKRPEIPPALEDLIIRAMALDPAARPRSATELEQRCCSSAAELSRSHDRADLGVADGVKSSSPLLPTPAARAATAIAPPRRRSKLPVAIAIVAAVGIGAVVANRGAAGAAPPATPAPPAPAVAEVTPVEPPSPVAVVPAKVSIKFDVTPAGATISIDGKPIAGQALEVDKDDARHQVAITATGFQPYTGEITFAESQKLVVKLTKAGPKPVVPRGKKPRPKKSEKPNHIDTESPYGN